MEHIFASSAITLQIKWFVCAIFVHVYALDVCLYVLRVDVLMIILEFLCLHWQRRIQCDSRVKEKKIICLFRNGKNVYLSCCEHVAFFKY